MRHARLISELADRLRRLEVSSLVYFHTDHFEPWRPIGSAPAVGIEAVENIHEFLRATERIDFARRLTLFYKPHLNYALRHDRELMRADPADLVGFLPRTEFEERVGQAGMGAVIERSQHEIQVHIHHEYYTATRVHTDPAAIEWFASPLGRMLDDRRLELAIRLNREIIARETGQPMDRWFFVHGQWALNASDESACTITNEIEILQRSGCCGDFTFPAGRRQVNPSMNAPYFCRPVNERKGYDRPEAEPELALGNRAAASSKFFIWASAASGQQSSIDTIAEAGRRHIANIGKAAENLVDNSYVGDGRLFIKTHAHSMHSHYFEHMRSPVFPHQHPDVQALLSVIFDAALQAGLEVEFLTASEVYERLVTARMSPADGALPRRWPFLGVERDHEQRPRRADVAAASKSAHDTASDDKARARAPAVEVVREVVGRVLKQRIDRLGTRGSGAYEHYSEMLRLGFPIPNYELAALAIVHRDLPPLAAYHEIGSGIGSLPFLLALTGCPAVGIECDGRRYESAVAIWRELAPKARLDPHRCRLFRGRFPSAARRLDLSQAVGIVTDFITTQTPDQRDAILAGLLRYRYALIDLRRFCTPRESRDEQLELLDELRGRGFPAPVETIDPAGKEYAFALFDNTAAVSRRVPARWVGLARPRWFSTGGARAAVGAPRGKRVTSPQPGPNLSMLSLDAAIAALTPVALEEFAEIDDRLYRFRVERGDPFPWYDRIIPTWLPEAESYHEVGAGIGMLPLLLGLMGRKAVAIDQYLPRIEVGRRMADRLAIGDRVSFVDGTAPAVFQQIPTDGACCISTNIGVSQTPEFIKDYLQEIKENYRFYLFDVCLLWGVHREAHAIQDMISLAAHVWGSEPKPIYAIGTKVAYYLAEFPYEQRPRRADVAAASKSAHDTASDDKARARAPAVEVVREVVGRVLKQRIDRLGTRGSGAYEHYSEMLRLGFPIPNYELAALAIVHRDLPPLAAYHEIGSGIGSLPFLLALTGCPAVGIECDGRRYESAVAIWRELAPKARLDPHRCRLFRGRFPSAARRLDLSQAVGIVTDFITTQTPDQRDAILAGLLRYRYALIDLRRFCTPRESRDEQLELLDELRGRGFPAPVETIDPAGKEYAFALFDNTAAVSRRVPARWVGLAPSMVLDGGRQSRCRRAAREARHKPAAGALKPETT
jgi:hypothetical protein